MREIKFMAYEKAYNIIREVVSINFADKTVVLKDDFFDDVRLLNFDDVNLMQYTGVKEKNGVEIYTGHMVKYFCKGFWCLGKILLHEGKFVIAPGWFKEKDNSAELGIIFGLHEILTKKDSELQVVTHICKIIDRKTGK